MMANTDFDRNALDINGDYLIAYGNVFAMEMFPETTEIVDVQASFKVSINGVEFNPDIRFGVKRVTKINRLRRGLGNIRYAKNKPLDAEAEAYQFYALLGCRKMIDVQDQTAPEEKRCLTLNYATELFVPAPSDATRKFQNRKAACATIAERREDIEPPENAVLA
jgi:hypothetical protein